MFDRDEVGLAVVPLAAALLAAPAFGAYWLLAILFGALAAYAIALSLAWPLLYLLRRFGLTAVWHFGLLGSLLSSPFSFLASVLGNPPIPPGASVCLVLLAGFASGALFWQIAQRGRNAL